MSDNWEADQKRLHALILSLTNHTPATEDIERIEHLRDLAKQYGAQVIELCPDSRERSLALTALEESTMWAVKSLVLPR